MEHNIANELRLVHALGELLLDVVAALYSNAGESLWKDGATGQIDMVRPWYALYAVEEHWIEASPDRRTLRLTAPGGRTLRKQR
jgi:hypothetical protein